MLEPNANVKVKEEFIALIKEHHPVANQEEFNTLKNELNVLFNLDLEDDVIHQIIEDIGSSIYDIVQGQEERKFKSDNPDIQNIFNNNIDIFKNFHKDVLLEIFNLKLKNIPNLDFLQYNNIQQNANMAGGKSKHKHKTKKQRKQKKTRKAKSRKSK